MCPDPFLTLVVVVQSLVPFEPDGGEEVDEGDGDGTADDVGEQEAHTS